MTEKERKKYVIGVDTGGTFTDIVVLADTGETVIAKAPTTPHDFSIGVLDAIGVAAETMRMSRRSLLEQCAMLKHGTTVATNAVITGHGAKVGFITTKGFEDTTLIGRVIQKVDGLSEEDIVKMPYITKPSPLVPKARLKGIYERIDFRGNVVVPLNIEDAKRQIKSLVEDEKVEAIGVSFLFSWMNPAHEQKVKELINQMYPGHSLFLTFSHELVPVIREYGRANTVIINCSIGRIMERYLSNLNEKLKAEGFSGNFLVMQSNGGTIGWNRVSPIRTLSSGPAGGVIGSQYIGTILGEPNAISTDMGGTSFDVSLILDGKWSYEREPIVSRWRLILPMIKCDSIGAGGGTIARAIPELHRLVVGPESAAADPGPVCYDRGGTEPTVGDANLLLGFLNPDNFWGGRIKLNKAKAEKALQEKIAGPLNMGVIEAAAGIFSIVNANMSDVIRRHVMRSGYVPGDFVLFAFGGTGPVHAAYYAAELGIRKVYCFPFSPVFSAFGIAGADIVQTSSASLGYGMPVEPAVLNSRLDAIEGALSKDMESEGYSKRDLEFRRVFNMRYRRQVNYLSIMESARKYDTSSDVESLITRWKDQFNRVYGKGAAYPKAGIELVSVDIDAVGKFAKPLIQRHKEGGADASRALKGHRDVFFPDITDKFTRTAIYEYDRLQAGNVIEGPAIVETPITTIVIPPQKLGRVDAFLNVVLEV